MSSVSRAIAWLSFALTAVCGNWALAQNTFAPQAGEYPINGALPGDQVFPHVAIGTNAGYVVWQDSLADGDGWGISAQALNNNLSGTLATFRVNQTGAGQQENPRVAMLQNGGAVFVWQGGKTGYQKIFARFLGPDGVFTTGDLMVNTYTNEQQITPAAVVLTDGTVIVVWGSFGQDGSMQGVFGQHLSATGQKIGVEFQINQTTLLNQRTPAVTALASGNYVVTWVSESLLGVDGFGQDNYGVDIYARLFDPSGRALGNEFKVNSSANTCANPAVSGSALGGFTIVWSQLDRAVVTNGWDVWARAFDGGGAPLAAETRVNAFTYGDQFAPRIETLGTDQLVVWTSLGQDGSREGVYGRFVTARGDLNGDEFRVNTTTRDSQMHPAVATDGKTRFLVVWASYTLGSQFDLAAQRYASAQPLPTLPTPSISATETDSLLVSWAELAGYPVASYQLYVDGSSTPINVTNNYFIMTGLVSGSAHTFRLGYTLTDSRMGAVSLLGAGTTWGADRNHDGLPDDWQARYWGADPSKWPGANVDSDGDGATNLQEYLAGTDPTDPNSVLRLSLQNTPQGLRLYWNSQPGYVYQVQASTNFTAWQNVGRARFAPGATDSVSLDGASPLSVFRVIRVR